MKIEALRQDHLTSLQILLEQLFGKKLASKAFNKYFKQKKNKEWYSWVLVEANQVVGVTGLYEKKNKTWLDWFGIHKSYRGLGLGRMLLNFTLNQAKSSSSLNLWTTNYHKEAIELYQDVGFQLYKVTKNYQYWKKYL